MRRGNAILEMQVDQTRRAVSVRVWQTFGVMFRTEIKAVYDNSAKRDSIHAIPERQNPGRELGKVLTSDSMETTEVA